MSDNDGDHDRQRKTEEAIGLYLQGHPDLVRLGIVLLEQGRDLTELKNTIDGLGEREAKELLLSWSPLPSSPTSTSRSVKPHPRTRLPAMAAVIALRPKDDRGNEILDELEARTEMKPLDPILEDGTRRYYLRAEDADIDAFDPMLDKIDREWRQHVNNWIDQQLESELDEELNQEELDEAWEEAGD